MPAHDWFRPDALRAARVARGWTKPRLIHALRVAAAAREGTELVPDESLTRAISGWENGHHFPTQYVDLLTDVYGLPAHELGLAPPPAPVLIVPGASYPTSSAEAVDAITDLWRADLNPDVRLDDLTLDKHAWQSASFGWLIAPGQEPFPQPRNRTQVGMGDVDAIRTTVEMFAEMDNRFGGGHARRALIQYLEADVSQMLAAHYSDQVGRALFSTVAEGSLLAAWMSYDSGRHGLAQRYFVHALRLAQTGDDLRLAASILSAMSHQATYLGDYRQATELARAAITGVKGCATPTLLAQFRSMEARALAGLGDTAGCSAALSQTATSLDRKNHDDDPEWITYFDEAEMSAEFGHCFRDLGRAHQASGYASESLSGTSVRSDFFATMVLADALLAQGEDEQACAVALQALDAGSQLKSARCITYLARFRAKLDQLPEVRSIQDFTEKAQASRLWQQAG